MIKTLVVEDDSFLGNAYKARFIKEGFDVVLAENGEEALLALRKSIPDIILTDLVMPVMDGFTTLEKIFQIDAYKNIPILVTTNLSQQEDIDRALKLGAKDYIVKSEVKLSEIAEKIRLLVKKT